MLECAALVFGLHLATYHFDRSKSWNEINPGVYVMCDGWTAGAYRNSEHRNTVYGGYTFEHGRFALTVGAATGYRRASVVPMAVPSVRLGFVRLGVVPTIKRWNVDGGVHLAVERRW